MRNLTRAAICAVVVAAAVGAYLLLVVERPTAFGDWTVASGAVRLEGRELVAVDRVELRDGERTLLLEAGTRLRRSPGDDPTSVPEIVAGRAELSTDGNLRVGEETLESGEERLRAALTPSSLRLLEGSLRRGGLTFHPGDLVPLHPVPSAVPGDPTAVPGSSPGATDDVETVGQVVDARTGQPVPDVPVTATYSRFDDGYPPLPFPGSQVRIVTDSEGFIRLSPFRPHDPRVQLHLETDHPDFESKVHVVERHPDVDARREFTVLRLRKAYTFRVRILAPDGAPLGRTAIQLTPPPIERDSFIGEDAWEEGRSLRAGRPLIRYTRDDGTLRLVPRNERLVLLHPGIYSWNTVVNEPSETLFFDHSGWPPGPDDVPEAVTRYSRIRSYHLQDSDGVPLAGMPVEIDLGLRAPVRLYTDDLGEFAFGPLPFRSDQPVISTDNPRYGVLTVKSPAFWKHEREVQFPAVFSRLTVEGRVAARLTFRLMTLDEDDSPVIPVPPNGLTIDRNLTLVHRDRNGEVAYDGQLPDSGTTLQVSVRGHLPAVVTVPTHDSRQAELDLGEVVVEPGERLRVQLVNPESFADRSSENRSSENRSSENRSSENIEARFLVADVLDPEGGQDYLFPGDGELEIGGLLAGHRYLCAVEGSRVPRVEGEFVANEKTLLEGLAVAVTIHREVECRVFGRIMLSPDARGYDYRVVERYFLPAADKPVAYRSYQLAEDGIFGSARKLPHPHRAEVFIHGPHLRSGYASRVPEAPRCDFDMGLVIMERARTARFRFRVEGFSGTVPPPAKVSLFAEENDDQELVGIARDHQVLELSHLRPGRYILRWGEEDHIEAYVFDIQTDTAEYEDIIYRQPRNVEVSELVLVDRAGDPVEGAVVQSGVAPGLIRPQAGETPRGPGIALPPAGPPELSGGHHLVGLFTDRDNELTVQAPGFLPALVKLPRGFGFETSLTLRKSARVEAQVRDLRGFPFDGELRVTWQHEQRSNRTRRTVVHGTPFTIPVVRGKFLSDGFPPGEHAYSFQHPTSEASTKRVFTLVEGSQTDVGKLFLEENRSVRGIVQRPDGPPAAEAIVALVPPEKSYRWPQRDTNLIEQEYSTKTDSLGRFEIEGLPLDLREDLALVARLEGYTDAVIVPVDLQGSDLEVVLLHETSLTLDLGYTDFRRHRDHEFRLEYIEGSELERDLGPLAPPRAEDAVYLGVSPGIYRARWNLKQAHPDVPPWMAEVSVQPARPVQLSLPITDRFVSGVAVFLDEPLERGWVIVTEDPGDPDATRIGRVRDGRFEVGVPEGTRRLYGALIPERNPLPRFNPYRGEAIPLTVASRREDQVRVEFSAYDLTIRFDPELLDRHEDLQIEFPHYRWTGAHYQEEQRFEPVEQTVLHLSLLRSGLFTFRVRAPGRFSRSRTIELLQDTVITFTK